MLDFKGVSTGIKKQKNSRYTIYGLDPLTEYGIKLAAANNDGSVMYCPPVTFRTSQPGESKPVIVEPSLPVTYDEQHNMINID